MNGFDGEAVIVERVDERVAVVTFNRPAARNPLDAGTVRALNEAVDALDESVRVVILTGAPPAFSAGGDLKGYLHLYAHPQEFADFLDGLARLSDRLERGPFVSIAMVNGVCAAGGLELMLSCDLSLAAASATIGDLHINYGQIPGAGGSQRLVRAVGTVRAKSLLLSGRLHTASEALAMGLVSEVVPDGELRERVHEVANELAGRSREAVQHIKDLVAYAVEAPQSDGLRHERATALAYATTSADAREGLVAFAESRLPKFGGR